MNKNKSLEKKTKSKISLLLFIKYFNYFQFDRRKQKKRYSLLNESYFIDQYDYIYNNQHRVIHIL